MNTSTLKEIGILLILIGTIYTTLSGFLGENVLNGILILVVGLLLLLMSLLLSEQKSTKKTKMQRKKREEKKAALYRISPKTEQKMPGESVSYTVSITNLLSEKIEGVVKVTIPEGWKINQNEITFGPVKKEEAADVTFEVSIPNDAKLGFVYKLTIDISFLEYSQELSAVIELSNKEDELLTIEEDEVIMKALENL